MDNITGLSAAVFAAGILSFFSPCILPLLPVYIGYFSAGEEDGRSAFSRRILRTLCFVAGISVVFFTLGAGAGLVGAFIDSGLFALFCGIFIVLMGLYQMGFIDIPWLKRTMRIDSPLSASGGFLGSFALGFFFSFSWTPCVGPVLSSVIGISLEAGSALKGGILLLIYSAGLAVPFVVMAAGSHVLLKKVRAVYPYLGRIKVAGGVLVAAMGIWMIANTVPSLTAAGTAAVETAAVEAAGVRTDRAGVSSPDIAGSGSAGSSGTAAGDTGSSAGNSPGPSAGSSAAAGGDTGTSGESAGSLPPGNTLSGNYVDISDWQGRPVYLKFWATWCPVCLTGLKEFTELYEIYEDSDDAVIYSVVAPGYANEVSEDKFIDWATGQGITFPVLFDNNAVLNRRYGIRAYPTSVFLGRDGEVAAVYIGHMSNEDIIKCLDSLAETEGGAGEEAGI